ncbi:hypothetical protein [Armatimonas sp.]|uniref:hypothetical protein n=1 Tax=Armatimonas sp. TaxID=1872638 RepID=UPI00374D99F7
MTTRVSTRRALRVFEGLEKRIREATAKAEAHAQEDAKRELMEASSGGLSTAELRRRDHPYARRHGTAREDPEVINEQTGKFKRSWRATRPTRTGNRLRSRIRNTDPKAKFMHGTTAMLLRPIIRRVKRRIRRIRRYRLQRGLWAAILAK